MKNINSNNDGSPTSKANRRDRVNIVFPSNGTWTIKDLQNLYPNNVNITLRFKTTAAVQAKELVEVGKTPAKMGRPVKVYARRDVSVEDLVEAHKKGIMLNTEYQQKVETALGVKFDTKSTSVPPVVVNPPVKTPAQNITV